MSTGAREHGSKGLTAEAVKDAWEKLKLKEQPSRSVLDGLVERLPALVMAYRLQEKAAGVGFDWPDAEGPAAKVREELQEVHGATVHGARQAEIGDLLFAVVNLARKLGVDPRAALEGANRRFTERFRGVEALARERNIDMATAGIAVLDGLWDEVKRR